MIVYVTKYALTQGVLIREVRETHTPAMVATIGSVQCFHKPDWHLTEKEAKERVKEMIQSKRNSIERMTKKLDKIERELG